MRRLLRERFGKRFVRTVVVIEPPHREEDGIVDQTVDLTELADTMLDEVSGHQPSRYPSARPPASVISPAITISGSASISFTIIATRSGSGCQSRAPIL